MLQYSTLHACCEAKCGRGALRELGRGSGGSAIGGSPVALGSAAVPGAWATGGGAAAVAEYRTAGDGEAGGEGREAREHADSCDSGAGDMGRRRESASVMP